MSSATQFRIPETEARLQQSSPTGLLPRAPHAPTEHLPMLPHPVWPGWTKGRTQVVFMLKKKKKKYHRTEANLYHHPH